MKQDTYDKPHIKRVLMERDDCTADEADERIQAAQEDFDGLLEEDGDIFEAERICEEHFGLEPDFIIAFLP